tara:strand:- start:521 stop:730 length:210 start_codon:yes stop_codon:yes gene_type:complete
MDHILECKKNCSVISGKGITKKELKRLKEKLGSTFSELENIKKQIETGEVNDNDVTKWLVGISIMSMFA